ncbi:hypothetical protein [Paenibacillus daejeonensis]|uniref:hypothetical protein n=1 Tax=Paenibacillus daejeonensis TaxID=135193 RepID=UPI0003661E05|nr:hypothetical protein [Paenibacillus daejeonensis]
MNKEKLVIPYPDEEGIQNEVERILASSMPPRRSFADYITLMLREVGLRHLFRDWTELTYVSLITISLLALMMTAYGSAASPVPAMTYVLLFTLSPVLYLSIALLFFAGKRDQETYQVEMVCKYNVYQLSALRMLVFGTAAIAVNTVGVGIGSWLLPHLDPIKGWLISMASLLLFGTAFLVFMRQSSGKVMRVLFIAGWLVMNLLLYQFNEFFYTVILNRIPLLGYAIWIVACGWYFVRCVRMLVTIHQKEGYV